MAGSEPGDSAAMFSRGDRSSRAPSGYRFLLPTLPSGDSMKTCLILHCDLGGRPYRIEDFRTPLQQFGVLKDIGGIGPFQMGHVWLIKLRTQEAKQRLITAGGIQVKGRFCAIIDPAHQELTIKVHWVPFHVSDEAVRRTFTEFGDVKDVRQDTWAAAGFESAESTTRLVRLTLRENLSPDELPHLFKLFGGSVLVVVPGRAPVCLRCRRRGHIRRDCRVPKCTQCRSFGHEARDCVRTYANVTGRPEEQEVHPDVMDVEEAERAATAALVSAVTVAQGNKEPEKAFDITPPFPTPPDEVREGDTSDGTQKNGDDTSKAVELDKKKEDDAASQHSSESTLTVPSDGYQTAEDTEGAATKDKQGTPSKRPRELTELGDEQKLQRLEHEWKVATGKKGKYASGQLRSSSTSRVSRRGT
ncbi:uncharacterized protein LOC144154144 [Haemaphysalis longicornis]